MKKTTMFAIGLTGGIGCGKTTVADLFAGLGAAVIDTDLLAHQVTAPGGAAMPAIRASFGDAFILPDGAMDRARMRERVFTDPAEKRRLEAILHPLIGAATEQAAAAACGPYLMYVVPLLVESGSWKDRVDRVLVIDCPEALQVERVQRRSGLSEKQVRSIMAAQVPRAVRLAAADDVLRNEGGEASLPAQVGVLHARYCAMAAQRQRYGSVNSALNQRKPSQHL